MLQQIFWVPVCVLAATDVTNIVSNPETLLLINIILLNLCLPMCN